MLFEYAYVFDVFVNLVPGIQSVIVAQGTIRITTHDDISFMHMHTTCSTESLDLATSTDQVWHIRIVSLLIVRLALLCSSVCASLFEYAHTSNALMVLSTNRAKHIGKSESYTYM